MTLDHIAKMWGFPPLSGSFDPPAKAFFLHKTSEIARPR
jgi:hypothetical protein